MLPKNIKFSILKNIAVYKEQKMRAKGRKWKKKWNATRSSANAEEPCEHNCQLKLCKMLHKNVRRIAFEKACSRWMTFKVIQGHCRCYHSISHIRFPLCLPLKVYLHLAPFSRFAKKIKTSRNLDYAHLGDSLLLQD